MTKRRDVFVSSNRNDVLALRPHEVTSLPQYNLPVIHLIGPGGAGKTTAGATLADRLDVRF